MNLAGSTDASAVTHTSENLAEVALQHIKAAKEEYGVKEFAVVTLNEDEHGQKEEDSAREKWYASIWLCGSSNVFIGEGLGKTKIVDVAKRPSPQLLDCTSRL